MEAGKISRMKDSIKYKKKMFCFFICVFVDFVFLICFKILCRTAGRVIDTISRMEPSRFFNISSEKDIKRIRFPFGMSLHIHHHSPPCKLESIFQHQILWLSGAFKKILVLHKSFDKILFLAIVLKIISIIIFITVNNS